MTPVELVLSRLLDARPTGDRRWRCACPAHGGANRSTLSIGEGENGAALLTCWTGCSIEQITAAIGLEVGDLFPPREAAARSLKRHRMMDARQALDLLQHEALTTFVVASDVYRHRAISDVDWARLKMAVERIQHVGKEVYA